MNQQILENEQQQLLQEQNDKKQEQNDKKQELLTKLQTDDLDLYVKVQNNDILLKRVYDFIDFNLSLNMLYPIFKLQIVSNLTNQNPEEKEEK